MTHAHAADLIPRFAEHITPPGHPERPERAEVFDAVAADVARSAAARCVEPRPATARSWRACTTRAYLDAIAATAGRAVDARPRHVHVAGVVRDRAAGRRRGDRRGASTRCDTRRAGVRAGAAARPPRRARPAMGFCLFNNVAVAAAARARATALARVAIVDIDVHHGNGTQCDVLRRSDASSSSRRTSFRSTRAPARPTRPARGAGAGFTVNVPLAGRRDRRRLRARPTRDRRAGARRSSRPSCCWSPPASTRTSDDPLAAMRVTTAGYGAARDEPGWTRPRGAAACRDGARHRGRLRPRRAAGRDSTLRRAASAHWPEPSAALRAMRATSADGVDII